MRNPLKSISMMRRKIRKRYRDIFFLIKRSSATPISFGKKVKMWNKGFMSESYLIYDFDNNDPEDYVSDHARLKLLPKLNGYYCVWLYDKLYMSLLMREFEGYFPEVYGLSNGGRFVQPGWGESIGIELIVDLCEEKGGLVVKPIVGLQGVGVKIIDAANGRMTVNGREVTRESLISEMKDLEDCLAVEFIRQHDYAASIFPRTVNTVRVMTLWDEDGDKPFIARAVHRFGNSKSFPVDNWTRGGVCAPVDIETGAMGKAVAKPASAALDFVDNHPETGSPIAGVVVPFWEEIKAGMLEMAGTIRNIPCIGWDVVVTRDGFKVIEANNCPGLRIFQVHSPLLCDRRIRKFFDVWLGQVETIDERGRDCKLPFKI